MLATGRDMIEDRFGGVGLGCEAAGLGCSKTVFEEKIGAQMAIWKALLYRFWVSVYLPKRGLTKQL